MANKGSPYPPSARRQVPQTGAGAGNDSKPPGQPAAGQSGTQRTPPQQGPEKDDPHWAPESGDKLDSGDKR